MCASRRYYESQTTVSGSRQLLPIDVEVEEPETSEEKIVAVEENVALARRRSSAT